MDHIYVHYEIDLLELKKTCDVLYLEINDVPLQITECMLVAMQTVCRAPFHSGLLISMETDIYEIERC